MVTETLQFQLEDKTWSFLIKNLHFSERHRLVYVSTPKVGCTSLKWWFANLTGNTEKIRAVLDSDESTPDLKIHDAFPRVAPDVIGLSSERLEKALKAEGVFRFAVVRNPFTRIFSAWQSKLLLREPLQIDPYKDFEFFKLSIASVADIALAFQSFLEHLADCEAPFYKDVHWTPQLDLLNPGIVNYSLVSKIEDTDELAGALATHLSGEGGNPFYYKRSNESLLPFHRQFITSKSENLIRQLYREDFSTFSYTEEIPPQSRQLSSQAFDSAIQAIELVRSKHQRLGEICRVIPPLRQELSARTSEVDELKRVNAALVQDISASRLELSACTSDLDELMNNSLIRFISRTSHPNKGTRSLNYIFKRPLLWTAKKIIRLVPANQEYVYRGMRKIYKIIPLSFETKRRWAEFVMAHNIGLREAALSIQGRQIARHLDVMERSVNETECCQPKAPRKRVLIIEQRIPTPDKTSGSLRLFSMVNLLVERGWEITFTSDALPTDYHWVLKDIQSELPKYERLLMRHGISVIYGMEALSQHLQIEGETYKLAMLSYPDIMHRYASLARAFMPNSSLIYDTVDLHGLRFYREASIKNNDPELLKKAEFYEKIERANLEFADVVVAITEDERREILLRAPAARIEVVPNIHSIASHIPPRDDREGLLFIGHYLHSPNEDAMLYFVNEVLPKVRERIGDVPLYMLGSSITERIAALASESVHAIGFVEDPEPWFARAKVFVAPLRYGAGMKGKIGQSLSLGLPIVTTSIGAEGMGLETEKHVLIADSANDFAAAVARLYEDASLWKMLSENGMSHVDLNFSQGSAGKAIDRLIATAGISL